MSDPKHFAIIATLAVVVCAFGVAQADVKATAILFRHGQRTPVSAVGTVNSTATEDLGEGQLTGVGSRQLYENGALLRLKYNHLFPSEGFFRLSNMQIMSSLPERTMMSLQSFMAGFFPPPLLDTTLPIWWQPFFCTVDHDGRVVYMSMETCPSYLKALMAFMYNPPAEMTEWVAEDREILDALSAWAGTPLDNAMQVMEFAEFIKAHKFLDKTVPIWVVEAYFSTLEKYVEMTFRLMHATPEMIKVRGGPLITEILENFEAVASGKDGKPIMIYSAHDSTLLSLAYVLGVEAQIPGLPNYSDTFMVDLSDAGTVQVIYMNTEKFLNTRTVMNIPGCGTSCSLATFRTALKDKIVTDLDALCAL